MHHNSACIIGNKSDIMIIETGIEEAIQVSEEQTDWSTEKG